MNIYLHAINIYVVVSIIQSMKKVLTLNTLYVKNGLKPTDFNMFDLMDIGSNSVILLIC